MSAWKRQGSFVHTGASIEAVPATRGPFTGGAAMPLPVLRRGSPGTACPPSSRPASCSLAILLDIWEIYPFTIWLLVVGNWKESGLAVWRPAVYCWPWQCDPRSCLCSYSPCESSSWSLNFRTHLAPAMLKGSTPRRGVQCLGHITHRDLHRAKGLRPGPKEHCPELDLVGQTE